MAAQLKYPLHWLVWNDNTAELGSQLSTTQGKTRIEDKDAHGRTPLLLAVVLGRRKCADLLLAHDADALVENLRNWTLVDEATCNGDPELLSKCYQANLYQKAVKRATIIPQLLQQLREAPDFYLEMKWEFTTWLKLPLLSKMCPSDVCKIWKKGANVRVDLSLLGFKNQEWVRGNRSFIFHGSSDACTFIEVDHDHKVYYPQLHVVQEDLERLRNAPPREEIIAHKLGSPVISTILGTDSLSFSRVKNFLGLGSEREEDVSGFRTKVYSATGVDIVTRTRAEHLTEADKRGRSDGTLPMQRLLGGEMDGPAEDPAAAAGASSGGGFLRSFAGITTSVTNVKTERERDLSADEYFLHGPPSGSSVGDEIGRPMDLSIQKQSFKATAWLADRFPLSLRDQVLPVIELMSTHSPHFGRVRDFIALQLPAGFPLKIDIPFFHIVQASITFGNLNGTSEEPPHVKRVCVPVTSSSGETMTSSSAATTTTATSSTGIRGSSIAGLARRRRRRGGDDADDESAPFMSGAGAADVDDEIADSTGGRGNLGRDTSVDLQEVVMIDDECFQAPAHYHLAGGMAERFAGNENPFEDEERLLQYAIRQSLESQGQVAPATTTAQSSGGGVGGAGGSEQVTFMEALLSSPPATPPATQHANFSSVEEVELQRALIASMLTEGESSSGGGGGHSGGGGGGGGGLHVSGGPSETLAFSDVPPGLSVGLSDADAMQHALALSASEAADAQRLQAEEDAELERIIQLSLAEN